MAWKSELSFSDRLTATTQMLEQRHYKRVSLISLSPPLAQKQENSKTLPFKKQHPGFVHVISHRSSFRPIGIQEDYKKRCLDAATNARNNSKQQTSASDHSLPPLPNLANKPSQTLGPYTNCVHHSTGLFSTIYITPSPPSTSRTQLLALKTTTPSTESPPHNSLLEARLLTSLSHPNILHLTSTHLLPTLTPTHFLLTYPFHPLTLSDLLSSTLPIPKTLLKDLFSALTHIHNQKILHRDIKPSNILLLSPTGPAILADFGIAWSPTDPGSEPMGEKIMDVGTTCYRAPESLFGCRDYGEGVDLWAAGCVVAEVFVHNADVASGRTKVRRGETWSLFDAGELGSELALIKSIFETLGTPNGETWPESKGLPDWGKMSFVQFPGRRWEDVLPGVGDGEREVMRGLVRFESAERVRAREMLELSYFGEGEN